jgi:glucose/arabinose dehydrogenase
LRTPAQDLSNPRGKILRWNDDGTVPTDNPFVQTPRGLPAIWSYGHRNPQGLSFDRKTRQLWSTEHGPRGGDELNWIRGGHNYGWPVISYGSRYDGLPVSSSSEVERVGMDQPVINWTPAIAVSAVSFYEGNEFPRWRSNLLIGSLLKHELWRVLLREQQPVVQELLLKDIGRIRAITTGSDGDIYLALELKQEGLVIRLSPSR